MMLYGESDYWVAQYRSMTEGSAQQQPYSVEGSRQGLDRCTERLNSRLFACRKLVEDIDRPVSIYLVHLSSSPQHRARHGVVWQHRSSWR